MSPMSPMLPPVLALIGLSLVIWLLTLVTRLPAIAASGLNIRALRFPEELAKLPDTPRQIANNYNHLMEQPTIFYAMVFYIVFAGHANVVNVYLAWAYVASRAVHSVIQCTVNRIELRLPTFIVSTLFLVTLAVREALALPH